MKEKYNYNKLDKLLPLAGVRFSMKTKDCTSQTYSFSLGLTENLAYSQNPWKGGGSLSLSYSLNCQGRVSISPGPRELWPGWKMPQNIKANFSFCDYPSIFPYSSHWGFGSLWSCLKYSMKNTVNVSNWSWYEQFSWMAIQRPVLNESLSRGFEQ